MIRSTFIALGLLTGQLNAQWQFVAPSDELATFAYDALLTPENTLKVCVNSANDQMVIDIAEFWTTTHLGQVTDQVALAWPNELSIARNIYPGPNGEGQLVTGYFSDPLAVGFENQLFIASVTSSGVNYSRIGGHHHGIGMGLGFIDLDSSLVYGSYDFENFEDTFKFRAWRYCEGSGICDSVFILAQDGIGRFHAMGQLAGGDIIGIMPYTNQSCSEGISGVNATIRFSDQLDTLGCSDCIPWIPVHSTRQAISQIT